MNDEVEDIIPVPIPFSMEAKIFCFVGFGEEEDDRDREIISMNEWKERVQAIRGINEDLLGKRA